MDKHLPADIRNGYPNPNKHGTEETLPSPHPIPINTYSKYDFYGKGILTCVLPDEDGPTSSVNCPSRNPPPSNVSILN